MSNVDIFKEANKEVIKELQDLNILPNHSNVIEVEYGKLKLTLRNFNYGLVRVFHLDLYTNKLLNKEELKIEIKDMYVDFFVGMIT